MAQIQPGYVCTVFRSRLRADAVDEYTAMAADVLAAAEAMPGFVSIDRFTADDGERLSVVVFDSVEHERAWRDHALHRAAQHAGRDRFYDEYSISVCEVLTTSVWARTT